MRNNITKPISIAAMNLIKNIGFIINFIINSVRVPTLLIVLILTLSAGPATAGMFDQNSPLIEKKQSGEIDWEKGIIRAYGTSADAPVDDNAGGNIAVKRLSVMRAAKIDAMRHLLDVIKTVRVDSTTNVESYIIASDFIRNKLHETIRKAQITNKKHLSNNGLELTVELPIVGSLLEILVPDTGGLASDDDKTEQESGIIIDARGLGAKPALSPRILDDSGREFYGASYIKREYFLSKGLVAYRTDPDDARNIARATSNPIIIKAIKSTGTGKTDLVISSTDVKRLKAGASNLNCLEKGNVLIVLD